MKTIRVLCLILCLFFASDPGTPSELVKTRSAQVQAKKNISESKYSVVAGCVGQSNKTMSVEEARHFVLSLINADRAKFGLAPVKLDAIASAAGQMHSDEMSELGYCAHDDIEGNSPAERYTACGGENCVGENLGIVEQVAGFPLDVATQLQRIETAFMDEKPPNDIHRQQILMGSYNKVGIGVSYGRNVRGASRLTLAQEFVPEYGQYSKLTDKLVRGVPFEVVGTFAAGVTLDSILVYWEPIAKALSVSKLRQGNGQALHNQARIMAAVSARNDPDLVKLSTDEARQHFATTIVPADDWKPGRYGVQITATVPGSTTPITVSLRMVSLQ